jgi:hypothetical protein
VVRYITAVDSAIVIVVAVMIIIITYLVFTNFLNGS